MSTEEIKTRLHEAFMDVFNNGNLAALDTICAANMVDHSTAAAPGQPNDLVAFQWEMSGTNSGPYMGRPASGNPIRIIGMNMERLKDGRIMEHWSYPDKLAALQQIGAIPA